MPAPPLDGYRCLVIDRLKLKLLIGILDREKAAPQEVVMTIYMYIREPGPARSTDIADYVSYAEVVESLRALAASGRHIPLVENLAEEIADIVLADRRVTRTIVDVRKTEIIPDCAGVGVIIERANTNHEL